MKFAQDQVLAVLRDATEPMSTIDIAQQCRRNAGIPARVAGSPEVRRPLDQLETAGLAVSATYHEPGGHGHLVPYNERAHRYWATPELSVKLAAAAEARKHRHAEADQATATFKGMWRHLGGPPFNDTVATPYCDPTPEPQWARVNGTIGDFEVVEIRLTHAQLTWLMGKLQQ